MPSPQPLGYRLNLSDQELLKQLLLTLRIKGDVEVISLSAIQTFGSLLEVLRQNPTDLKKIKGLTPSTIHRLKVIYSVFREIIKPDVYPTNTDDPFEGLSFFRLTAPQFDGEAIRLLYLNEDHGILKDFIYKKGSGNHVQFYARELVKEILGAGISNVVLIHHKEGSVKPSPKDKAQFVAFGTSLKTLDIKLVDYLIMTKDAAFSLCRNQ
ncbi:MAG: hypothetical protein K2Y18_04600 [Alphaproteobacteria bacterium]|jgi:DNA repair protein RadC|nr:hypothetical protein [Alphaproteobacteria bacterium]